jgi:hypothetical protein
MTKKNFIAAANVVKTMNANFEFRNTGHRELVIYAFILLFKADNPNFDEIRFREACACEINTRK